MMDELEYIDVTRMTNFNQDQNIGYPAINIEQFSNNK